MLSVSPLPQYWLARTESPLSGSEEAAREHYKTVMPLGRMGEPEDIANIALFLSCELSEYLCGEVIIADGGRMHIG